MNLLFLEAQYTKFYINDFSSMLASYKLLTLLTQNIEDSFEAKKKAGAVFIDLTAAYDTVWHRGLTCKLLKLLPDKHMVRMIMKLVRNRSFTLTIGDSKQSRLRRLKKAFLRDRSWLPSYLTSTCTIFLS